MFKQHFDRYALDGDRITCRVGEYLCVAEIIRDNDGRSPDKEMDGFWPSRSDYKSDAAFERAYGRAALVMQSWKDDDWFWCGVEVRTFLTDQSEEDDPEDYLTCESLWGIECNYPVFDKRRRPNTYLREVANELLSRALKGIPKEIARRVAERMTRRAA